MPWLPCPKGWGSLGDAAAGAWWQTASAITSAGACCSLRPSATGLSHWVILLPSSTLCIE